MHMLFIPARRMSIPCLRRVAQDGSDANDRNCRHDWSRGDGGGLPEDGQALGYTASQECWRDATMLMKQVSDRRESESPEVCDVESAIPLVCFPWSWICRTC
jgi:hypothetical protein